MKSIIRYLLSSFLLFICLFIYPRSDSFRGLSATDGLSDLVVSALYRDSVGYVWMGTASCVERFDGVHLKHYPVPGTNERLKWVNVIAETPGNKIWVGNDMGLWQVNHEKETLEPVASEVIKSGVRSLLFDGKGTLYIGSKSGLFLYKDGQMERIMVDPDVLSAANSVMGLNLDERGMLWMITGNGLYSMSLSDKKMTPYPYRIDGKPVTSYKYMTRVGSVLYIGTTEQGILSFDILSKEFNRFVDVGCNVISSLSSDGKGTLYVGTDGNGVHFVSTETKEILQSFRHEIGRDDGLRSNSVYSLMVDRDGLIWVGFYQMGLDYTMYQSGLFSTYSFPPYFDSKDVSIRSMAIGTHEKLLGSRDGLFYIDEKNNRFKSFKKPQLRSDIILSIHESGGKYYVGTYGGGMYVFESSTMTIHDFEPGDPMPFIRGHVFSIRSDYQGNLWIATSRGVYCYKGGRRIHHFTSTNSKLPEGNVYDIFFDSSHKGWICTENGACIWDPSSGSMRTDVFPEGFVHKEKIRTVYEDSKHNFYFLPDKGHLFVSDLSMNRFGKFRPDTPLDGKDAMFMIEDREGGLWIGTNYGLYRCDQKKNIVPYNFTDGIPSPIFISCYPVMDANGTMWFGNSGGLIYIEADRIKHQKRYNYPIRITDVYVNGKQSEGPVIVKNGEEYEITLDDAQKNITICFSELIYTNPAYISYEYKLEGRDEAWQTLTGKADVTFYDLSSGKYRFKVRRVGDPESEVELSIRTASVLGAGTWSALIVAAVLLVTAFVYYNRKRKKLAVLWKTIRLLWVSKEDSSTGKTEEKYKTNNMSHEECKRLEEKLDAVMSREKPYTNQDLKIADLADLMGVSAYTLSYFFNQYLKCNYYDYVNDLRIAEFKRLVDLGEHTKYTLNALVELCGFGSRASFFRNFKKATGITPSEYIQNLEKTKK